VLFGQNDPVARYDDRADRHVAVSRGQIRLFER
jgi:hypothetical protein